MLKERPYELNQKLKRMQASRDNLKDSNREKMLQNKKLRDRNEEITQSRDMWRARTQELEKAINAVQQDYEHQIEVARQLAGKERIRAENERAHAEQLQRELEDIKKSCGP
jgi:acyl-CoA synthetase (NDP forming)